MSVRSPLELKEAARQRQATTSVSSRPAGAAGGPDAADGPATEPVRRTKQDAFLAEVLPLLSPMRPLQTRLSGLDKLIRNMQRYQYEPSQLAAVWSEVQQLLSEGHSNPAAASFAYKVMNTMSEWHRDGVDCMRGDMLEAIRTGTGSFEHRQEALAAMVADGEAVDPFGAQVVWLLTRWLVESDCLDGLLSLIQRVLRKAAFAIGADAVDTLVSAVCDKCLACLDAGSETAAVLCLPVLDTVVRFSHVTPATLPAITRTLCKLVAVDYATVWPVLRNLLLDEAVGGRCFLYLIRIVEGAEPDAPDACVKGAVFAVSMSRWGSQSVAALSSFSVAIVLRAFASACRSTDPRVVHEVVSSVFRLVRKFGSSLCGEWDELLSLLRTLRPWVLSCPDVTDGDTGSPTGSRTTPSAAPSTVSSADRSRPSSPPPPPLPDLPFHITVAADVGGLPTSPNALALFTVSVAVPLLQPERSGLVDGNRTSLSVTVAHLSVRGPAEAALGWAPLDSPAEGASAVHCGLSRTEYDSRVRVLANDIVALIVAVLDVYASGQMFGDVAELFDVCQLYYRWSPEVVKLAVLKYHAHRASPCFADWLDTLQVIAGVHYISERSPIVREAALQHMYEGWQRCRHLDDSAVLYHVLLPVLAHVPCDIHSGVRRAGMALLGKVVYEAAWDDSDTLVQALAGMVFGGAVLTRRGCGAGDPWLELHPSAEAAVSAVDIACTLFKRTFTRAQPARTIGLLNLLLPCCSHDDPRVRLTALQLLCKIRSNHRGQLSMVRGKFFEAQDPGMLTHPVLYTVKDRSPKPAACLQMYPLIDALSARLKSESNSKLFALCIEAMGALVVNRSVVVNVPSRYLAHTLAVALCLLRFGCTVEHERRKLLMVDGAGGGGEDSSAWSFAPRQPLTHARTLPLRLNGDVDDQGEDGGGGGPKGRTFGDLLLGVFRMRPADVVSSPKSPLMGLATTPPAGGRRRMHRDNHPRRRLSKDDSDLALGRPSSTSFAADSESDSGAPESFAGYARVDLYKYVTGRDPTVIGAVVSPGSGPSTDTVPSLPRVWSSLRYLAPGYQLLNLTAGSLRASSHRSVRSMVLAVIHGLAFVTEAAVDARVGGRAHGDEPSWRGCPCLFHDPSTWPAFSGDGSPRARTRAGAPSPWLVHASMVPATLCRTAAVVATGNAELLQANNWELLHLLLDRLERFVYRATCSLKNAVIGTKDVSAAAVCPAVPPVLELLLALQCRSVVPCLPHDALTAMVDMALPFVFGPLSPHWRATMDTHPHLAGLSAYTHLLAIRVTTTSFMRVSRPAQHELFKRAQALYGRVREGAAADASLRVESLLHTMAWYQHLAPHDMLRESVPPSTPDFVPVEEGSVASGGDGAGVAPPAPPLAPAASSGSGGSSGFTTPILADASPARPYDGVWSVGLLLVTAELGAAGSCRVTVRGPAGCLRWVVKLACPLPPPPLLPSAPPPATPAPPLKPTLVVATAAADDTVPTGPDDPSPASPPLSVASVDLPTPRKAVADSAFLSDDESARRTATAPGWTSGPLLPQLPPLSPPGMLLSGSRRPFSHDFPVPSHSLRLPRASTGNLFEGVGGIPRVLSGTRRAWAAPRSMTLERLPRAQAPPRKARNATFSGNPSPMLQASALAEFAPVGSMDESRAVEPASMPSLSLPDGDARGVGVLTVTVPPVAVPLSPTLSPTLLASRSPSPLTPSLSPDLGDRGEPLSPGSGSLIVPPSTAGDGDVVPGVWQAGIVPLRHSHTSAALSPRAAARRRSSALAVYLRSAPDATQSARTPPAALSSAGVHAPLAGAGVDTPPAAAPAPAPYDAPAAGAAPLFTPDLVLSLLVPIALLPRPDERSVLDAKKLADTAAFRRALSVLDRTPAVESHKIGVLFVRAGQSSEEEVLGNSGGSADYHWFLHSLGESVDTLSPPAGWYLGGLDTSDRRTDGRFALCWRNESARVVFHVPTMMPQGLLNRKRHVGNDNVVIAFLDPGADFSLDTLRGAFPFVLVCVQRVCPEFFRVTVRCKPGVPPFGPVGCGGTPFFRNIGPELPGHVDPPGSDFGVSIVSAAGVAALARLTAVHADMAVRVMQGGQIESLSHCGDRASHLSRVRSTLAA